MSLFHTYRHPHTQIYPTSRVCHYLDLPSRTFWGKTTRASLSFRTTFRFCNYLIPRKKCASDWSEVNERFFALTKIWSNMKNLEKNILIRGQHGFGDKRQVLLSINVLNTCFNIWLVCITNWQVMANFGNSWSSWKLELLGFGTLF